MNPEEQLAQKAAVLARSSPRAWEEFLKGFEDYSATRARQCVQAPLEELQRIQGRAQQCASLHALFADAVKTADRIAMKTAAKRSSP